MLFYNSLYSCCHWLRCVYRTLQSAVDPQCWLITETTSSSLCQLMHGYHLLHYHFISFSVWIDNSIISLLPATANNDICSAEFIFVRNVWCWKRFFWRFFCNIYIGENVIRYELSCYGMSRHWCWSTPLSKNFTFVDYYYFYITMTAVDFSVIRNQFFYQPLFLMME